VPDRRETLDDIDLLLDALPTEIAERIRALPNEADVIEVVMDLGRRPEARFGAGGEAVLLDRDITDADLEEVVANIGSFGEDNRAGIERTLHRISAIRNRSGKVVGLTCRVGRAVFGTIEIINDLVESGKSVLIMGRPGVGKTTMLREAARVLADDLDKRVVVVDTSNEIAGDGDIPHPAIGRARRMQVRTPLHQHAVMIEAVENHMPQVIVIDEIGTEQEAGAARTIAERGVQLIGTAHGNSLDNLMLNPTLSDLIGGIQSVTLGDEEARRRRTQKSVLERKAPPTFDVVVEIQDRDRVMVHVDVADTVDALLRGEALAPELRWRDEAGVHRTQARPKPGPQSPQSGPVTQMPGERFGGLVSAGTPGWRPEPAWRPGAPRPGQGGFREVESTTRPGYRPGAAGGWRSARGRGGARPGREGGPPSPWEGDQAARAVVDRPFFDRGPGGAPPAPFLAGDLADRGPLERGTPPPPEPRARDHREFQRQAAWRASAERALDELGTDDADEAALDEALREASSTPGAAAIVRRAMPAGSPPGPARATLTALPSRVASDAWPPTEADLAAWSVAGDEEDASENEGPDVDEASVIRLGDGRAEAPVPLDTLRVWPFGISVKRLEQAVRELRLPVIVVREADEADLVMTLRNVYKQKAPGIRDSEERGLPIFVLKSNTQLQMEACLTSLYALEMTPNEAAMREVEEAIGLVRAESRPVELSPQNAYLRRLQHQAAERANLVSHSRGREPFRRVRLYPQKVRSGYR
jgi:stage III sporulation protein SpoIIIAA